MGGTSVPSRLTPLVALDVVLLALTVMPAATLSTADYQALAAGVDNLTTSNYYASEMTLYGNAMALDIDPNSRLPIISATSYGQGRVITFGRK